MLVVSCGTKTRIVQWGMILILRMFRVNVCKNPGFAVNKIKIRFGNRLDEAHFSNSYNIFVIFCTYPDTGFSSYRFFSAIRGRGDLSKNGQGLKCNRKKRIV